VSKRLLPDEAYAYPDGRNIRIAELEAEAVMLRAVLEVARKRLSRCKCEKKKGRKP
jgi:hypothetical protein